MQTPLTRALVNVEREWHACVAAAVAGENIDLPAINAYRQALWRAYRAMGAPGSSLGKSAHGKGLQRPVTASGPHPATQIPASLVGGSAYIGAPARLW